MGEILGLGCTHYPGLLLPDERLPNGFHHLLTAPNVPERAKDRANWPDPLLAELGNDRGVAAGRRYGARMADGFRAVRASLEAFDPDFVLIFGDDQYENFREDIIPAFCVMGLDQDFSIRPWAGGKANRWNEPADREMKLHGQRDVAKFLARALIDRGIDMSYAYKTLHQEGLAHAFTNTLLYLDWDRKGFPWPVLPFAVNCYGSNLIHAQGRHEGAVHSAANRRARSARAAALALHGGRQGRSPKSSPSRRIASPSSLPRAGRIASCRRPTATCGPTIRPTARCSTRWRTQTMSSGGSARASRWSRPASMKCSTGWR